MGLWDKVKNSYTGRAISGGYNWITGELDPAKQAEERYPMQPRSAFDLPGYQQRADSLNQFADTRGGGEFRQGQLDTANYLSGLMHGQNSLAAEQMRQQRGQLQAGQMSMAAGARPGDAAMAQRSAMQNAGSIGAQMAGQSQMAQIAERNAAANALGGLYGQGRGQDIDAYIQAQNLGLLNARGQQEGTFQYGKQQADRFGAAAGQKTGAERLVGVASDIGKLIALSDPRTKEDVRPGSAQAQALLDAVKPQTYNYSQDEVYEMARRMSPDGKISDADVEAARRAMGRPTGRQLGVMAPDVERAAPGAVTNTPQGKAILIPQFVGALAGGVGELKKQVDDLRGAISKPSLPAVPSEEDQLFAARNYAEARRRGTSAAEALEVARIHDPFFEPFQVKGAPMPKGKVTEGEPTTEFHPGKKSLPAGSRQSDIVSYRSSAEAQAEAERMKRYMAEKQRTGKDIIAARK